MEPEPPPKIPRKALWATLLIPPGVVFGLSLLTGAGDLTLAVPIVGLLAILFCQAQFMTMMLRCYRGRSMMLMGFFYFMGQVIVGFSLWLGGCLIRPSVF
jgi:hypothetical protein